MLGCPKKILVLIFNNSKLRFSELQNCLVFFHKKKLPPKINKTTIQCPKHSVELREVWDNILPWFLNLLLKLAFFEKEAKKNRLKSRKSKN